MDLASNFPRPFLKQTGWFSSRGGSDEEMISSIDINLNEVRNELESLKKDIEYFKEAIYNF